MHNMEHTSEKWASIIFTILGVTSFVYVLTPQKGEQDKRA